MDKIQSPWVFRNVEDTPDTPISEWDGLTWLNFLQYGEVPDLRIVSKALRSESEEDWVTDVLELARGNFRLQWSPLVELVIAKARGDDEPFNRPMTRRESIDESL